MRDSGGSVVISLDEVRTSDPRRGRTARRRVEVPSRDALGLVLAADVVAAEPVPPFANTAMDGYAVRPPTPPAPRPTRRFACAWSASCPAGHAPTIAVGAGEAIRIMTGAPMPDGADAIVMVERTRRDGDDGVLVQQEAPSRRSRAAAGGDVEAG